MEDWDHVFQQRIKAHELRETSLAGHAICLLAIGNMGYELYKNDKFKWKNKLKKLKKIDWSRSNRDWIGRALVNKKVNKSRINVLLTSNYIKSYFNLKLDNNAYEEEIKYLNDYK